MTTAIQPELDFAAALDSPAWPPSRWEFRQMVVRAVVASQETHGTVHISTVRPFMPKRPDGKPYGNTGSVIAHMATAELLEPTGRAFPNGDARARNANKLSREFRLVADPWEWANRP